MKTIRIDNDVYEWLQSLAKPFEDNPNSVLRKIAKLDLQSEKQHSKGHPVSPTPTPKRSLSAKTLAKEWGVAVKQAYYHQDGVFYQNLTQFPGALFDPDGYKIFETEKEYNTSPFLKVGKKLNVPNGISSLLGNKRIQ